jgi:3-oxoacyl-[acyl-carrier protein] reductase
MSPRATAIRTDRTESRCSADASPRWAALETLDVGATASCTLVVSSADVDAFARLSADTNPLHLDPAAARDCGFSRPVAHGMIALGAISRLIGTELPGPGSLWLSQDLQFAAPVLVGDRLEARVTVEQISRGSGTVKLRTEVLSQSTGAPVLVGSAMVKVLQRHQPGAQRDVADRVAIVSGSSRGLGRAIAQKLASGGARVLVHFHDRAADAEDVVQSITTAGGEAALCQADLTSSDGIAHLFASACHTFGKVDIVINNATPPIVRKPLVECQWDDCLMYLNAYVQSCFRLAVLAAPGMRDRGYGRIVNVLSSYAHGVPPAGLAPYITAKSALAGLSRAMAVELGPWGITVNAVSPSLLLTDQTTAVGDRARQLAASQNPLRRLAEVDDVANVVAFLASEAAGYVTGAVIPVAGGEVMPA